MDIAEILSIDQIIPDLAVSDRWSAIDALIDLLARTGKIQADSREPARKAVKDREAKKSTGIGYSIALPHASVAGIPNVVAAFARLTTGVEFQALDNQPVTICLLFLTPQGQFEKHLLTLSAFARVLSNPQRRQALQQARTAEEILEILRSAS